MQDLETARKKVDEIDEKMRTLFEERMKVCADIAAYKKTHGLPIRDAAREEELLQKQLDALETKAMSDVYSVFMRQLIGLSRIWQAQQPADLGE